MTSRGQVQQKTSQPAIVSGGNTVMTSLSPSVGDKVAELGSRTA
jgi:hypothetical protein